MPIPPRRLRARIGEPDVGRFIAHGRETAEALTQAAGAAGTSLADAEAVLDFGCGCGRVLQPLLDLRGARPGLAGSDVDAEAIAWLSRATAGRADCLVNQFLPPLPFPARQFDVVYTLSILTHLDEATQDLWLAEIERVLAPGGLALVSVHGEHPYEVFRRGEQSGVSAGLVERLRSHGTLASERFVFEPYKSDRATRAELPGISGPYGLSFQHPRRIAERWAERFELIDYHPRLILKWQDLVVMRVREPSTAPPTPPPAPRQRYDEHPI